MVKYKIQRTIVVAVATVTTLGIMTFTAHANTIDTKNVNGIEYVSVNSIAKEFKTDIKLNGEERNYVINGKKIDIHPNTHFAIIDGQYSMLSSSEITTGPLKGLIAPGKDPAKLEGEDLWVPTTFFKQNKDIMEGVEVKDNKFSFKVPEVAKPNEQGTTSQESGLSSSSNGGQTASVPTKPSNGGSSSSAGSSSSNGSTTPSKPSGGGSSSGGSSSENNTPSKPEPPKPSTPSAYVIQERIMATGFYKVDEFGISYDTNPNEYGVNIGFAVSNANSCSFSVGDDSQSTKNVLVASLKTVIPSGAGTVSNKAFAMQTYSGSFDGWNVKVTQYSGGASVRIYK